MEDKAICHQQVDDLWASLDTTGYSSHPDRPKPLPKHLLANETTTTQSKGRRSWFESPPVTQIAQESSRRGVKPLRMSDDEGGMEVLTLTHFTNPPRIDFGKIKPGVTRRRQLRVSNPHDYDQQVTIERVPQKKHFSVEETEFVVAAEQSVVVTISWRPEEEGPCREMFLFLIDGVYRLQTIVFGHVQAPPQKRRDRKGLLGSRVKKPFSVLHTQNFANIKQSYTPRRSGSKGNVVLTGFNKQISKSKVQTENIAPSTNGSHCCELEGSLADDQTVSVPTQCVGEEKSTPVNVGSASMNHGNSVRRSTTYTKIGLSSDAADRTTVLADSSASVLQKTPPSSDTTFLSLNQGSTSIRPADVSAKLNFDSPQDAPQTPDTLSAPLQQQRHCYISPNTFLKENMAAASTPNLGKINQEETTTSMFVSTEKSFTKTTFVTNQIDYSVQETTTHSVSSTHSAVTMTPASCKENGRMKAQVQVSPMSFLRESLSNTPNPSNLSATSDTIPSPGTLLNNSVPHDLIVRHLGSVRNSLTGNELPKNGWKPPPSPIMASPSFPIFIKLNSNEKPKKTANSASAVVKTKPRRRSGTRCSNQKKLFKDIPDSSSPRRSTFLLKSKSAGKAPTSVQRLQKAGSKVIGKVKSVVGKTAAKSRSSTGGQSHLSDEVDVMFSSKESADVSIPLEIPEDSNPSRFTMVVKKPKVLKSGMLRKVQHGKDQNLSPSKQKKSLVDSSTITKPKQQANGVENGKHVSTSVPEASAKELFPQTPTKNSLEDVRFLDIGTPQPLPTSPEPVLTRRATLTVTKSRPSDALLHSTLSEKGVLDKTKVSPRNLLSPWRLDAEALKQESQNDSVNKCSEAPDNGSKSNNSTFNKSSETTGLSKIFEDYSSTVDSASSTEVSPQLEGNELEEKDSRQPAPTTPSIDRKETFSCPDKQHFAETMTDKAIAGKTKKVSPFVDREERFLTSADDPSIKDTPVRSKMEATTSKTAMRRQLAQSTIVPSQEITVTTQKKRYHSDSSAIVSKHSSGYDDRPDKRKKITNSTFQAPPKTRTRRATDSSVKTGSRRQRPSGRPGVAQSRLVLVKKGHTALPKHPMPFAAKNVYYDERWIEKQERGFVKWLNFILTPPEEYQTKAERTKVDAGSVNLDPRAQVTQLPPTKEVLSLRAYSARRRMNRLRRAACRLYQTDEVVRVIQKVEAEVESLRVAVRKDRMVHADVGIKQQILDLILSYSSLWLRIGLETIFGEIIPVQSNSDVIGLSHFVLTRLLGNPDIAMEFSHPSVPHLYRDGYQHALSKHVLKKFLMLVYFLDSAKRSRLIDHDPCLFCKDAQWKASKDLLFQFSKDYLSGEGDITRHLGFLGYSVSHVQLPLDEFDYAVTNLAKDLRDGLRLTRVVELLTQTWDLCRRLRVPAISRLQKIHNVELTFKSLTQHSNITDPTDGGKVSPRDIVDGHREKTLALLWNFIFNFQLDVLIDEAKLQEEVNMLSRCLRVRKIWDKLMENENQAPSPMDSDRLKDSQICQKSNKLRLLLAWARAVSAFYGLKVENFTVSFSDGRALCYLVHHYYPGLLPLSDIQSETSMMFQDTSPDLDDSFYSPMTQLIGSDSDQMADYDKLLANERENFRLLYEKVSELGAVPLMLKSVDMSNTIPDERVVITYLAHLCARLLDVQEEMRAARVIQVAWRRYKIQQQRQLIQQQRQVEEHRTQAACCIQRRVRLFLAERQRLKQHAAAVKIQTLWRGRKARKLLAQLKWEKENEEKVAAACLIQRAVRAFLDRCQYLKLRRGIVRLQAMVRGSIVRRDVRRVKSARKILQFFRAWKQMKADKMAYLRTRQAAVTLQKAVREHQRMKRQSLAAVVIQAKWKSFRERKRFLEMRRATISLQSNIRMVSARRDFLSLRSKALVIQHGYRALVTMKSARRRFVAMQKSAVVIQAMWRGRQLRQRYQKLQRGAIVLQTHFRGYKSRVKFRALRLATIIVQRRFRAQLEMQRCQRQYMETKSLRVRSATTIQQRFRCYRIRKEFLKKRQGAVVIQSALRGLSARNHFKQCHKAAVTIQQAFRRHRSIRLQQMALENRSAISIQSAWRSFKDRQSYLHLRRATLSIQTAYRLQLCRKRFLQQRKAAVTIQQRYRAFRMGEAVRLELDIMIGAAVTIQCAWKRYRAEQQYKKLVTSTLTIQRWWRGTLLKKRFTEMRHSAFVLQKHFRNSRLMKNARTSFCEIRGAALCLQKYWRRRQKLMRNVILMQARRKGVVARRDFVKKRRAAKTLQRQVRLYLTRKQEQHVQLVQNNAATLIQSKWRSVVASRNYNRKRKAVICVQANFKRHRQRQQYLQLRSATVTLQTYCRAVVQGRKQRSVYLKQKNSTVLIQSAFRGLQCKQQFKRKMAAILTIQSKVRAVMAQRLLVKSVVTIQRVFRAHQTGMEIRQRFLQQKMAALTLQLAWRRYLQGKAQHKLRCIVKIQAAFRKYVHQRRYVEKRAACIRLQTEWRKCLCRRRFQEIQKATVCIQRHYRAVTVGYQLRQRYQKLRSAVICIQITARGMLLRRRMHRQQRAAILIQSSYRTFRSVREYKRKKKAAIQIQQWYRCRAEIRSFQSSFRAVKLSAVKIQAVYKGYKARKLFLKQKQAAVNVQCQWRGVVLRRKFIKLRQTVVSLQGLVRANQAMRKQRQSYCELRWATLLVQAAFREKQIQKELRKINAARRIQSTFRGFKERKKYMLQKTAAILIQAHFRGCRARSRYQKLWWASMVLKKRWLEVRLARERKEKLLLQQKLQRQTESAIKVQRWFRNLQEGMIHRKRFLKLRDAVINIQRFARGNLVRRFVERTKASIVIQTNCRRLQARQSYLQKRRAAIKIQSWARCVSARCLLERRRFAVRILQRNIRAHLLCAKIKMAAARREESACKIQSWYRSLIQGRHRRRYAAAIKIQSVYKGYVQRRLFCQVRWATLVIQRRFRHRQALRAYHYLMEMYDTRRQSQVASFVLRARREISALTIQRAYRRHRQLEKAKKHLVSLVLIQRWIRAKLVRVRYVKALESVRRIQRCVREWRGRRQAAATTIQTAVRDWLHWRRREKRKLAITKLQAHWRGYQTRRRNSKKLKLIRARLHEVNCAATEEKKLHHRTASALDFLLRYKQLAYILEALMHLEVVTRLSGECCLTIVEGNAVGVIYTLIRSCNRSLPHMELIRYAVSILLNLAKFDRTIHAVYDSEDSLITLVELMQIYREKGIIFTKTCTLLGILALSPIRRQEILLDTKLVDKIRSIHSLTARKQKIEDSRLVTKNKLIAARTSFNSTLPFSTPSKRFPKVRPDWLLRRDSLKVFENPLCAITFVMESLQISPKNTPRH